MRRTHKVEEQVRTLDGKGAPVFPAKAKSLSASPKHCAYNLTKECFLGLEVAVTDLSNAGLEDLMAKLALQSGEGLWMAPFRGVRALGMLVPLDLIFLDQDCRVIETIVSFSTFRSSPSSESAASVLALPAHSISSSQTELGDELVLCVAEEMEQRLERLSRSRGPSVTIESAVLLREKPLWSGGPGVLELESGISVESSAEQSIYELSLTQPGIKAIQVPGDWLHRWWSPDPRKAPAQPWSGTAAYYWTGASVQGSDDAGLPGRYAVTEEHWYPATLVLMVVQRTGDREELAEHSIEVQTRGVRRGEENVSLQFVIADAKGARREVGALLEEPYRNEFDQFLQRLRKSFCGSGKV